MKHLPCLIVVMGLPGSGKTYFARRLARLLNAERISSDQVRRERHLRGRYSQGDKRRVYESMMEQASDILKRGQTVILDATFHRRTYRSLAERIATEGAYPLRYIKVAADDTTTRERTNRSRSDSEATYAVYRKLRREAELLDQPHLALDSSRQGIDIMLHAALDYLTNE